MPPTAPDLGPADGWRATADPPFPPREPPPAEPPPCPPREPPPRWPCARTGWQTSARARVRPGTRCRTFMAPPHCAGHPKPAVGGPWCQHTEPPPAVASPFAFNRRFSRASPLSKEVWERPPGRCGPNEGTHEGTRRLAFSDRGDGTRPRSAAGRAPARLASSPAGRRACASISSPRPRSPVPVEKPGRGKPRRPRPSRPPGPRARPCRRAGARGREADNAVASASRAPGA